MFDRGRDDRIGHVFHAQTALAGPDDRDEDAVVVSRFEAAPLFDEVFRDVPISLVDLFSAVENSRYAGRQRVQTGPYAAALRGLGLDGGDM